MYSVYLETVINILKSKINYLQDKFTELDAVIENVEGDYIIRPSFNFGVDELTTNLRQTEIDCVFTLQIFSNHNSNFDIVELATAIKKNIYMITGKVINNKLFLIKTVDLIKNYDSNYRSINIQFKVNIL